MAIKIDSKDNVELVVRQADNALHAYLNGEEVFKKDGVGAKQPFEEHMPLSKQLRDGYNVLLVLGVRWGGNALWDCEVLVNGTKVAEYNATTAASSSVGIVWDLAVEFMRESTPARKKA